jgi:hypothetical protein
MLKDFGYSTIGIFYTDYFFRGVGSSYDTSFPSLKATHKLVTRAILMGEFRSDAAYASPSRSQFDERKYSEFESVPGNPRFIYMHDNLPGHSQNSGACRPDETDLFRQRLIRANDVMIQDVELIAQKDPGAIVIVAGDHGPYLTKNCTRTGGHYDISDISRLDVQDRFGTFLAIKWPTEGYTEYDDIVILQDLFPVIFAYLFEDETILESKAATLTSNSDYISGVSVENGIIHGGIDDGEPLFLNRN